MKKRLKLLINPKVIQKYPKHRRLYNFYLLYIVIGLSFLSIGISKALFEDPTVESNLYFIAAIFFLFLGESYCNLIYNKIIRKEILKL